jgi:hypothetical protein
VYALVLAFTLGLVLLTWRTPFLRALRVVRSSLHVMSHQTTLVSNSPTQRQLRTVPTSMTIDCAVQTEIADTLISFREKAGATSNAGNPSQVKQDTSAESGLEDAIIDSANHDNVEFDALKDLEAHIYVCATGKVIPAKAVELISEDRVLTSIVSTILDLYGGLLPFTCLHGDVKEFRSNQSSTGDSSQWCLAKR